MIVRRIPLTQGKFAFIDDKDFCLISQHKWYVRKRSSKLWYAYSTYSEDGKQISLPMHRYIMGCKYKDGKMIDHINHNGLDNQRKNLRFTTCSQNQQNRRNPGKGFFWSKRLKRWVCYVYRVCDSKKLAKQMVNKIRKVLV